MKVGLCAICKNENDYLHEWVSHYLNLGFDRIFLYDNNELKGQDPKLVLTDYLDRIDIVDLRGKYDQQYCAYNHCKATNTDYDWIAYFDCDEFLILNKDSSIKDYLSRDVFINIDCIAVNWLNFDDNDLIGYENNYDRSIVSRFTRRMLIHPEIYDSRRYLSNKTVKSITRSSARCGYLNPHLPRGIYSLVNSVGDSITYEPYDQVPNYELCQLNHYSYKTIIEYLDNKMNVTYATGSSDVKKDISPFFCYNEFNLEKYRIFDSYMKGLNYHKTS